MGQQKKKAGARAPAQRNPKPVNEVVLVSGGGNPEALLAAALLKAQGQVSNVAPDAENTHHKYAYTTAESIIEEAREALNKAGLTVERTSYKFIRCRDGGVESFKSVIPSSTSNAPDKVSETQFLDMRFTLRHESGASREYELEYPVVPDRGRPIDKAMAATLTTSLSYFLRDLLQISRKVGPSVDEREDDKGAPTGHVADRPIGAVMADMMTERLENIGRSPAELRDALVKIKGIHGVGPVPNDLPDDIALWPARFAPMTERLVERAELKHAQDQRDAHQEADDPAHKEPVHSEPGYALGDDEPPFKPDTDEKDAPPDGIPQGASAKPAEFKPWKWVGKTPMDVPSPAHPVYWRDKIIDEAVLAIEYDEDLAKVASKMAPGADARSQALWLVENIERVAKLPDADCPVKDAVKAYKAVHDDAEKGKIDWATYTIPF